MRINGNINNPICEILALTNIFMVSKSGAMKFNLKLILKIFKSKQNIIELIIIKWVFKLI